MCVYMCIYINTYRREYWHFSAVSFVMNTLSGHIHTPPPLFLSRFSARLSHSMRFGWSRDCWNSTSNTPGPQAQTDISLGKGDRCLGRRAEPLTQSLSGWE